MPICILRTCVIAELNPQKMFDHKQTYVRIFFSDYSSACNAFVLSQQTSQLGSWLLSLIKLPTNSQLHFVCFFNFKSKTSAVLPTYLTSVLLKASRHDSIAAQKSKEKVFRAPPPSKVHSLHAQIISAYLSIKVAACLWFKIE